MNLIRTAPVTSITTVEALTACTLTFLVAHHVIGNVNVGTTTQTVAPLVSLLLPVLFGAAKWALVTPTAKVQRATATRQDEAGITDTDFGHIELLIELEFQRHLADLGGGAGVWGGADAEYVSAYAEYLDGANVHSDLPGVSLPHPNRQRARSMAADAVAT